MQEVPFKPGSGWAVFSSVAQPEKKQYHKKPRSYPRKQSYPRKKSYPRSGRRSYSRNEPGIQLSMDEDIMKSYAKVDYISLSGSKLSPRALKYKNRRALKYKKAPKKAKKSKFFKPVTLFTPKPESKASKEPDNETYKIREPGENNRNWLVRLQDNICLICKKKMSKPSIEHLVPKAHGGGNELCNLAATCTKCNNERGTEMLDCVKKELAWRRCNERELRKLLQQ